MSYSKKRTQGLSLYLENWNPTANKYVLACANCGAKGYSRTVESADFLATRKGRVIREELSRLFELLDLDESGICTVCAGQSNAS